MSKGLATAATIAALVTAFLVWWLLGPWSPLPPANPPGTRIEWAEPAAAPLPVERVDAGAREAATGASAGGLQAADRSITLRARFDDGRPGVGARVDVGALQTNDDIWPRHAPFEDEPKPPVQASFTTDANGEVRVPWRHDEIGDVPITVRHGFAFGTTTIRSSTPAGSTHEVRLALDQSLQVRVVDANDRPAPSVFVGVQATTRSADGSDHSDTMLARSHTGAASGATFAHVQRWLGKIAPQPARTFELYAWLPGGNVGVTIDAAALPREPVVLRIPPAGSIEVTAQEADGTPLTGATIGLADPDTDHAIVAPITEPATTIAHVPLGRKWHAWIPTRCDRVEFDGPRTAGETVKVELRAEPCPIVIGRLMRDGTPLANTTVSSFDGLRTLWLTPVTDADGRFRLTPGASREPVQKISFDVKDGQRGTWRATWRGNLELTPATHDLGDLHLERLDREPLMVSGRVVAPGGLDSVRVAAFRPQPGRATAVEQHATLRPDGTFTIHGADPGGELALSIESWSHLDEPSIPFVFGQRDLVVTLHAGVRLVASFPVASRELAQCLRVGLEEMAAKRHEADDVYVEEPDWRRFDDKTVEWTWDACEPGRYRLTVRFDKGPGKPVVNVDVNLPADAREVRLPAIAVPEARLVRLQIPQPLRSDRQTEPFSSVRRIVGDEAHDIAVEEANGQWFLAAQEPIDLRVQVPGYRTRVLRAVFADTVVTLEPPIAMDLIVDAHGVPDGAKVSVTLFGDDAMLDAGATDGRARFALPDAGEYSLLVRVGLGWADMEEWHCEPDTITVPEHGGTFTIRAQPPAK